MRASLPVWGKWFGLFALITPFLSRLSERPDIRTSHGVLAYLILIIGASRQGGRVLSLVMTLLGYIAVDFLFVPPRMAFGVRSGLDWWILLGFLVTGLLVSQLFYEQKLAARVAEERTAEVERLSKERLLLERQAATVNVLREADRIKNALINSIAHDLRSPVATLSLLADPAAGFKHEVALQRVNEEASRLGEFISTLQRFATEGEGRAIGAEPRAADALLQTALSSSAGWLEGRTVRNQPSDAALQVICDPTLSALVLGNLLQNAARHSPAVEPIDICVREVGANVHIVVADRGPGLGDIDVERVFTPLRRRVHDTEVRHKDRMGMGLAIARTFARAQRGDVTYEQRVGGGAEFVLRLPRAQIASPLA